MSSHKANMPDILDLKRSKSLREPMHSSGVHLLFSNETAVNNTLTIATRESDWKLGVRWFWRVGVIFVRYV